MIQEYLNAKNEIHSEYISNMENTRLINLLKSFSPDELREFELFVTSPFYNRENALTGLFVILKQHYPEFTGKDFNKERYIMNFFRERNLMTLCCVILFRIC